MRGLLPRRTRIPEISRRASGAFRLTTSRPCPSSEAVQGPRPAQRSAPPTRTGPRTRAFSQRATICGTAARVWTSAYRLRTAPPAAAGPGLRTRPCKLGPTSKVRSHMAPGPMVAAPRRAPARNSKATRTIPLAQTAEKEDSDWKRHHRSSRPRERENSDRRGKDRSSNSDPALDRLSDTSTTFG